MKRFLITFAALSGLLLTALLMGSAQEQPKEKASVRELLARKVRFGPLQDPKMTLAEVIAQLGERHGLTITVNERAFRADGFQDVNKIEIVGVGGEIKEMNVPLAVLLRIILDRVTVVVPDASGAIYTINPSGITISTNAWLRQELGRNDEEPIGPLVYRDWDKATLKDAIKEIMEDGEANIVIDPRLGGDKAATAAVITARLHNVPLGTAVRVLASMADLEVIKIDNVYYISDAGRILKLTQEQQQRTSATPRKKEPKGQ